MENTKEFTVVEVTTELIDFIHRMKEDHSEDPEIFYEALIETTDEPFKYYSRFIRHYEETGMSPVSAVNKVRQVINGWVKSQQAGDELVKIIFGL